MGDVLTMDQENRIFVYMNIQDLESSAADAASLLRSLANEKRLMIVCQLMGREMSVGEICDAIGARQSTVSQQLAILRNEGVVKSRKEAQTVYYSLADDGVRKLVAVLHEMFCAPAQKSAAARGARAKAPA